MATVHDLRVDAIVVGERLRPLSEPAVVEMAESFKRIGQIQPITINRPNGIPRLVTGHHRLMAARRLKLETISCVILPAGTTADDCLQIEIAENLHRSDLTKDERDRHIRLLAEIIERQAPIQVSQNGTPEIGYGRPPPQTKGVVARVAEQVGLSKQTVRRALSQVNEEAEPSKAAKIDNAVADDAANALAEHLVATSDHTQIEAHIANAFACGAKRLGIALTNLTGRSIMDGKYAA